jgi:DNA-binding response OmpR family regulator
MASRRVLIADDDEDAAMSLGDLLTIMGHDVSVALDVSSVCSTAARHKPHLVLIEIGMHSGGGLEACRRLRASLIPGSSMIVALSAWTRLRDRLDAYEAGCSIYLFKPVETGVLEAVLAGGETLAAYEAMAAHEARAAQDAAAERRGGKSASPSDPRRRNILPG